MSKKNSILWQTAKRAGRELLNLVGSISSGAILVFILLQAAIVIFAFLFFGFMPVYREAQFISKHAEVKFLNCKSETPDNGALLTESIIAGKHIEAFLESTLQLAGKDSISLLIDLDDSLAILTYKGVKLFESKISSIELNPGLKKIPQILRDSLFSGPQQAKEELSSIEKFTLVVKKAPGDTAGAKLTNAAPTLPVENDVFWLYSFGNNLVIEIGQQENDLVGTRRAYRSFKKTRSQWFRAKTIKAFKFSEQRGYTYHLSIEIHREDARSIYRALPLRPFVAVRY
jgi:hypothetical protein